MTRGTVWRPGTPLTPKSGHEIDLDEWDGTPSGIEYAGHIRLTVDECIMRRSDNKVRKPTDEEWVKFFYDCRKASHNFLALKPMKDDQAAKVEELSAAARSFRLALLKMSPAVSRTEPKRIDHDPKSDDDHTTQRFEEAIGSNLFTVRRDYLTKIGPYLQGIENDVLIIEKACREILQEPYVRPGKGEPHYAGFADACCDLWRACGHGGNKINGKSAEPDGPLIDLALAAEVLLTATMRKHDKVNVAYALKNAWNRPRCT